MILFISYFNLKQKKIREAKINANLISANEIIPWGGLITAPMENKNMIEYPLTFILGIGIGIILVKLKIL